MHHTFSCLIDFAFLAPKPAAITPFRAHIHVDILNESTKLQVDYLIKIVCIITEFRSLNIHFEINVIVC